MKKILILYKERRPEQEDLFLKTAQELKINLVQALYSDLLVKFMDGSFDITIHNHDLSSFDLVYFRHFEKNSGNQTLVCQYCIDKSIPLIDSIFSQQKLWTNYKSFDYLQLSKIGISVIPSYLVSKNNIQLIEDKLSYPIVSKINDGSKGEGVHLCSNSQELHQLLTNYQTPMIVQPYIENTGDLRLFVIGDNVIAAIKRINQDPTEFRNNVSLGGKAIEHQATKEETELALRATKALLYDIAGVDIITDQNGKQYIMEVNMAPQFAGVMQATGIDIPLKIMEYLVSRCK